MREDELVELLEQLDPARHEEPPAPGSSRYTAIQEQAMNATITTTPPAPADTTTPQPRRPLRRWRFAAAAAAAAVVVAGAVVLRPGSEPSAEAAIRAAADELAAVTSLRSDMHFENDIEVSDVSIAVAGGDFETVQEMSTDGDPVETYRWVVVDGVEYYTYETDGTVQTETAPVDTFIDEEGGSFAESSAAVVDAVLEGADVDEVGVDEVRGVEATHYRLGLAEAGQSALAALPDQQLDWFGLIIDQDHLDRDVTVDIWVADGLIRRLDVSSPGYGSHSIEYYDFNADITITPPPGPYVESSVVG